MWGFADIHTHPMAHLGFGGHLLWGRPSGPVAEALAPCNGTNHGGPFSILGSDVSAAFLDAVSRLEHGGRTEHPTSGFPDFAGWPVATTICHQQMYVDWIRRAYDGGLRVITALAVNNRLSTWIMEARQEGWDDETVRRQIEATRALARANPSWMEVALSADHAERIVAADKLAVILGVEVDQIELFISHDPSALATLEDEATRFLAGTAATAPRIAGLAQTLFDLGVRQISPLHLANNIFGGAALYMDKTAANNHWLDLWRNRMDWSDDRFWLPVAAGDPDVEFKLQASQVPFNRKTFLLDLPRDNPFRVPHYADPALPSHANSLGLTAAGRVLLSELWKRSILVDVDHLSGRAAMAALSLAERFRVPLLASHCSLRAVTPSRAELGVPDQWWSSWDGAPRTEPPDFPTLRHEGMRTDDQLGRMYALGGMAAVATHQPATRLAGRLAATAGTARAPGGSLAALAGHYLHAGAFSGPRGAVAVGSDMNGFNQSVLAGGPRVAYGAGRLSQCCTGTACWDINEAGMAHYGLFPDMLQQLSQLVGRPAMASLFGSAGAYIAMWHRAEDRASAVTRP